MYNLGFDEITLSSEQKSTFFYQATFTLWQHLVILALIVKVAKEQGKKAFISVDRLIINDVTYTMKTLYKLLHDLQPA